MKSKTKIGISAIVVFIAATSLYIYPIFLSQPVPSVLVKEQLLASALSPQSIWSQKFLDRTPLVKSKIIQFEAGTICQNLKTLNTKLLTHEQISNELKNRGYICVSRPLSVNPKAPIKKYLKIDKTTTENPEESGVAYQEVCYDAAQRECVIRIKRDGFPLNRRSNPHSSKAVLLDAEADPASYENEAFKIGGDGQAIPKGPHKFGLKKCPYKISQNQNYTALCEEWVDLIMEQAHPTLREPKRTQNLSIKTVTKAK
jgi:hypothetical protein